MATWFQGPAADFIRVSREGFERGVNILHFLGGHSVDLAGSRAVSQTKMTILAAGRRPRRRMRRGLHGRFYDFLEKRERAGGGSCCASRSTRRTGSIRSTPRRALELDADLLARFPAGYRHLAYVQTQIGYDVKRDMPGLVGPAVERLYRRGCRWLAGGEIGEFGAGIASDPDRDRAEFPKGIRRSGNRAAYGIAPDSPAIRSRRAIEPPAPAAAALVGAAGVGWCWSPRTCAPPPPASDR